MDEFNFLAANQVTDSTQFMQLKETFLEQLVETDKTLEQLDDKMTYLNKVLGALMDYQNGIIPSEVTMTILDKAKVDKDGDTKSLRKEIKELQIERETLHKVRDQIVNDYDFAIEMTNRYDKSNKESKRRSML